MQQQTFAAFSRRLGWAAAATLIAAAGFSPTSTLARPDDPKAAQAAGDEDVLTFKNGTELKGTIVSETETKVKIKGTLSGIAFESEYDKSEILTIKRGSKKDPGATPAPKTDKPVADPADGFKTPPKADTTGKVKTYVINLNGMFGEDISQTPLRRALKDAKEQQADLIICVLENKWSDELGNPLPETKQVADELFRAEPMCEVISDELAHQWADHPPRLVMWVKQAMGGAAFLPFVIPEIYMSSEAKIGGIGNMASMFTGVGDKVVQQKQYSLRLGHAEGWAIKGGHDVRIIRAMAITEYVLSVKITGAGPEYYERMADPLKGEILLTDDGNKEANRADTPYDLIHGMGNDTLTLDAKMAANLRVSKGTADSMEELFNQLGIERTALRVDKKSTKITSGWSDEVKDAKKSILRLLEEYRDVRVEQPGGENEQNKALSARISKLQKIIELINRYEESLTNRWRGQNGVPPVAQLQQQIDVLRREIQKKKR